MIAANEQKVDKETKDRIYEKHFGEKKEEL